MTTATDGSRARAWLMAIRPQTLPAGTAPVVIGVGLAVADGVSALGPAVAALLGALLIQIGTNFANDYFDAVNGVDDPDRDGFTRVTAGGLIRPRRVKYATVIAYALACVVGLYLVAIGGLPILVVGLSSIVAGVLYTGGPYPYGYYGLGDLFVFVYFGVVAVTGAYYVQAVASLPGIGLFPTSIPPGTVPFAVVLSSLAPAGLSTAVLVVNNVRDRETDAASGKQTLAVLLGYTWSRIEFAAMVGLGYVVPVALWLVAGYDPWVLLPVLTLPLAASITHTVWTRTDGAALNGALERTGQLLVVYSLLLAVGFVVPEVV